VELFALLGQRNYHSIKAQFRLTAQRLGQLRIRKDAQGQVIGRDVSILLQQGNETLARAKAQRLIQDEIMGDLLRNLEMQIGYLLEHFSDLKRYVYPHLTPLPTQQSSPAAP
jgi:Regulator of Vps4 activity in the MVB pathway